MKYAGVSGQSLSWEPGRVFFTQAGSLAPTGFVYLCPLMGLE